MENEDRIGQRDVRFHRFLFRNSVSTHHQPTTTLSSQLYGFFLLWVSCHICQYEQKTFRTHHSQPNNSTVITGADD